MNDAVKTAIAARAREAELLKKKIMHDFRERMNGQILEIEEGKCFLSDLQEMRKFISDAIGKLAAANAKIETAEIANAFEKQN